MTAPSHRRLVITIDGPAGAGKSTTARRLASRLGYRYLDTGALYRAVAWKAEEAGIDCGKEEGISRFLKTLDLQVGWGAESGTTMIMVGSKKLGAELRSPEITRLASAVAALPVVRDWLLPIQQRLGEEGGLIAEGRDMGTRVFPNADVKFFLDASLETRASRRHLEIQASGRGSDLRNNQEQIAERDARDRTRAIAPLKPAEGAVVIDSTALTLDDVVETMLKRIPDQR